MQTAITTVLEFLNSPLGITAMVSLLVMALNYLYGKKPSWMKYEGSIISGIKMAEKAIPDDVDNKSLKRLDHVLRYIINIHHKANGKLPNPKQIAEIKEGIHIVHNQLEGDGTLS